MIVGTHGATVPMNEMYPTSYLTAKRYKDTARVSIVYSGLSGIERRPPWTRKLRMSDFWILNSSETIGPCTPFDMSDKSCT